MECAICYQKFYKPKTQGEFKKIYNEIIESVKNNNYDEIDEIVEVMRMKNFIITPKHNTTHSCSTPNCESIICCDCWTKITHNGKNMYQVNENDIPNIYQYFECPFCRQIDWKGYMNNVFNELQQKVLGNEDFYKVLYEKTFN